MKFKFHPAIAVEVGNLAKARKFYTGVLGMIFLGENDGEAALLSGGAAFYISESKKHKTYLAFDVDSSLPEAKKILRAHGCKITSEGPYGFMVDDPHGLSYYISQPAKQPSKNG